MARRKPPHVQRNRQLLQRQTDPTAPGSHTATRGDEDASIEPSYVSGGVETESVDGENHETEGSNVEAVLDRPFKRPRTGLLQPRGTCWLDTVKVALCVDVPSTLLARHAPWNEEKRVEALWMGFHVDMTTPLGDKLRELEGVEHLSHSEADVRIGLCDVCACGDEAAKPWLPLADICDEWGRCLPVLLQNDLVTMEVRHEPEAQYELWFGVDWKTYAAVAPTKNDPFLESPVPRSGTLARSMRQFMIWLLHRVKKNDMESVGDAWEFPYPNEIDVMYSKVFDPATATAKTEFDIHDVYSKIDVRRQLGRETSNIPTHILSDGGVLLPRLREYQKAALSWMLAREGVTNGPTDDSAQNCCVRFVQMNGSFVSYNLWSASFEKYIEKDSSNPLESVRGGILADEMGLGKTVEVIALILSHPPDSGGLKLLTDINNIPKETANREKSCVCGSDEDCDPGWVQCEVCLTWHHQLCTGYNATGANNTDSMPDFICFQCQSDHHIELSCKTTLIVSPESIHDQWESEIKRHVKPGTISLLRYPGVKAVRSRLQGKGPSAAWSMRASMGREMASYDIVITKYEALSSDVYHVPTTAGKERRSSTRQKRKKYAFIASPLVFLKFWRVCMDEAQVGVENTQLQAALTVAQIRTHMQWIVTGTPFSTQLGDLYGCFKFLRLAPYADDEFGKTFFSEIVESCFSRGAVERVYDLLIQDGYNQAKRNGSRGGLLWRTCKKDVLDQLGLPCQSQELIWCRFSEIERVFYEQQETNVVNALLTEQQRRRVSTAVDLDGKEEVSDNIWHRLLLLRQICCHPQVGQALSGITGSSRLDFKSRRRVVTAASTTDSLGILTMDDFLQQLTEQCRRECEEAQRKLIAAHNGHASIALIKNDIDSAIIKYMLSVDLIRSNWAEFRADLLPRLHILENLASCIRRKIKLPPVVLEGEVSENETHTEVNHDGQSAEYHNAALLTDDSPKKVSMMPELFYLRRAISEAGIQINAVDNAKIAEECEALEMSANIIRRFYLLEGEYAHSSAVAHLEKQRDALETRLCERKMEGERLLSSSSLWWISVLDALQRLHSSTLQPHAGYAMDRLRAHLYALGTKWATSFAERFHSVHGLSLALVQELGVLYKKRKAVMKKLFDKSRNKPTKEEIELSGNCKKCRDGRDGAVCWHCKFYRELEGYKQHMLGVDSTIAAETTISTAGWASDLVDLEVEDGDDTLLSTTTASTSLFLEIFRQIASSARSILKKGSNTMTRAEIQSLTKTMQEGLQQETEVWNQLVREWTRAKQLFQAQHQRLGALDELEMARMKIRLRMPNEPVLNAADKLYKLEPYEVPLKLASLDIDRTTAEAELKQKQGHLRYLKHVYDNNERQRNGEAQSGQGSEMLGSEDNSTCAVCLENFGEYIAVLPCAHITCRKCSDLLAQRLSSSRSIRCPTCRKIFRVQERKILHCRSQERSETPDNGVTKDFSVDSSVRLIKAGFGCKIDAVLRRVRALVNENPDVKAILFTQWMEMSLILTAAFKQNGIKCFTYTTKKQFHRVLQDFKHSPDPCVLALPFTVGANGLNIIEATEVLLVEPLLNTSIEAQAINRIHRIGQTKATRVHRFVVDNSIEERIYWLGQRKSSHRGEESDTTNGANTEQAKVDDSLVVGRHEKEKLTIAELQALLNGRAIPKFAEEGATDNMAHPFWLQLVEMNGRAMSRQAACDFLVRRHATERRVGDNSDTEPTTLVVNQVLSLSVAKELLSLDRSNDGDDDSDSEGLLELVRVVKERVRAEFRLWEESRQRL